MKGFMIAAPNSGAGKTVITLTMLRALKNIGLDIAPAKAGPDFIDPSFHQAATGVESYNLDCWAMRPDLVSALSARRTEGARTLVVEAMMGLFDGAADGSGSSADLAKMLGLPVIFVVDCASQSHSVAALVKGFESYMPGLYMAGVILNKVGSDRHELMLRQALERIAVPILGVVRRHEGLVLPSRHLGLVQASEHLAIEEFIANAASIITDSVDLDQVVRLSKLAGNKEQAAAVPRIAPLGQHIAVAKDDAFRFVYPHLLGGWRRKGVEISFFSPLADEAPSEHADAVYLCGGYPELFAAKLAAAKHFKRSIVQLAAKGGRIYGECGGYMTLGESLEDGNGIRHEMLGLLPLHTSFKKKKLHLGYRRLEPAGHFLWQQPIRGHEFHYASIIEQGGAAPLFKARDALGTDMGNIGLHIGNVAGSFIHVMDIEGE